MTTPYILQSPGEYDWQAYFRRVLPDRPKQARLEAYQQHMKFGPLPTFWSEFVCEAYCNHTNQIVRLTGLPDVPESRPHSRYYD